MQNNQVSLARMILNLTAPAQKGLSLNQGEIVKGTVQAVKDDGLVALLLKGRLLQAASEVAVKTGEEIFLQVDHFKDGKAYLKVLAPREVQQVQNQNISSSLQQIGVLPEEKTMLVARSLLNNNLPVSRENITVVSQGAASIGIINSENAEIAALALSRGIPLETKPLLSLQQFLGQKADLGRLINIIMQDIKNTEKQDLKQPVADRPVPFENTINSTDKWGTKTDTHAPAKVSTPSGGQVQVDKTGESTVPATERQVFSARTENATALPRTEPAAGAASRTELGSFLRILPVIRETVQQLLLSSGVDESEWGGKLKDIIKSDRDIIHAVKLLEGIARNDPESMKNSNVRELVARLETLEREFIGQKIFNYISRNQIDNNVNYYYFSFPVEVENEYRHCELRLTREPGQKSLKDQDNINFVVSLHTGNMGNVLFHVNWYRQGRIELQGVVETEPVKYYLENNLNQLLKSISLMGYQVETRGIKVVDNKDQNGLKGGLRRESRMVNTFAIDITI